MTEIENKRNVFLLVFAILIGILVVGWIAWEFMLAPPAYHAVTLSNGQMYFGQLQKFPTFGLSNVYTIQMTGNQQNPLSIQRFRNAFWGPEDFLKINRDEVVWMAELQSRSQLVQLIQQNPNLAPQQQRGAQTVPGTQGQQSATQNAGQQQTAPAQDQQQGTSQ